MSKIKNNLASSVALVSSFIFSSPALAVIIDNGTIQLGVLPAGNLIDVNLDDASKSRGITFLDDNNNDYDVIVPGCYCEGWGLADRTTGSFGQASANFGLNGGYRNLVDLSNATVIVSGDSQTESISVGDSAFTSVDVNDGTLSARVSHNFVPSESNNLYQIDVSITNTGSTATGDLVYRRAMDFDVPPIAYNEYITIEGWPEAGEPRTKLEGSGENGFNSLNPDEPIVLSPAHNYYNPTGIPTLNTDFTDLGPGDFGQVFDLKCGILPVDSSCEFSIYYGGASSETEALAALADVNAKLYGLAQSDPLDGGPVTVMFAFNDLCYGSATVTGSDVKINVLGCKTDDIIEIEDDAMVSKIEGAGGIDYITITGNASVDEVYGDGNGQDNSERGTPDDDLITINTTGIVKKVDGGAGIDTIIWKKGTVDYIYAGPGSDPVTISASEFNSVKQVDGGDDILGVDVDTLTLLDLNAVATGANITNWENIIVDGSQLSFSDNQLAAGTTKITGTGILDVGNNFDLTGNLVIDSDSVFIATGSGASHYSISGSVTNNGVITSSSGSVGDVITINNNYAGSGSVLLDANTDTNEADSLAIAGSVSGGTTTLGINDVGSGVGRSTGNGAGAGIPVVRVGGSTSENDFKLGSELIVGAYIYELDLESDNVWYLQSELLPQTDPITILPDLLASSFSSLPDPALLYTNLPRSTSEFQMGDDQCGDKKHKKKDDNANTVEETSGDSQNCKNHGWIRVVGTSLDRSVDNTTTSFEENREYIQFGFDRDVGERLKDPTAAGWQLGFHGHVGTSDADTFNTQNESIARIESDLRGFGISSTWLDGKSSYVDIVTQYTDYDSEAISERSNVDINGKNLSLSLATGKVFKPWADKPDLLLNPQVKLILSEADFDPFVDQDNLQVSSDDGSTVTGRIGVKLIRNRPTSDEQDGRRKMSGYIAGNLNLSIDGDTSVIASGTELEYSNPDAWVDTTIGGILALSPKVDLFGELNAGSSLDSGNDLDFVRGDLGLRYRFTRDSIYAGQ